MFPNGKKGMKDLMKQAQKMQEDLLKTQQELANKKVEVSTGGGMVKLEMNGHHKLTSLVINPEAVDPDDVEMLEDLILSAVNEANEKIEKNNEQEMSRFTGGMKIPGLF